MKYFILYTSRDNGGFQENYFKAKTYNHLFERISHYSNGAIKTSNRTILTSNISCGYLREIDLKFHPELSRRDFKVIDENRSYCVTELNDMEI